MSTLAKQLLLVLLVPCFMMSLTGCEADGGNFGSGSDTPRSLQDPDGDGVDDEVDNCPGVSNPDQLDYDNDLIGDLCDPDGDGDGVDDTADNCAGLPNPEQNDQDNDGLGDVCDSDRDGDTQPDDSDNCPLVANQDQLDSCLLYTSPSPRDV